MSAVHQLIHNVLFFFLKIRFLFGLCLNLTNHCIKLTPFQVSAVCLMPPTRIQPKHKPLNLSTPCNSNWSQFCFTQGEIKLKVGFRISPHGHESKISLAICFLINWHKLCYVFFFSGSSRRRDAAETLTTHQLLFVCVWRQLADRAAE